VKRKPIRNPNLISAVFSCISPFALVGFIGYVRWIQTSSFTSTWEGIAALFAGAVSTGLFVFSMLIVVLPAISLLLRHCAMKRAKAAGVQQTQDETPPEEFFAAHRQAMMAINELILDDSVQERPPPECFFYSWHSPVRDFRAGVNFTWPVDLTEEQQQMLESLGNGCHFCQIKLTPDSITYNFDCHRTFTYVLQYSKSWDHLQHLDGKWYYDRNDNTERESL